MTIETHSDSTDAQAGLHIANVLGQKAMQAKTRESLIFVIVNDTINMIRYDRALLWDLEGKKTKLIGISGETNINTHSSLFAKWTEIVDNIVDKSKVQILTISLEETVSGKDSEKKATLLWLPIIINGKPGLGLWLELWNTEKEKQPPQELIKLLINFLLPVYAIAWEKLPKNFDLKRIDPKKWGLYFALTTAITLLFVIQVPLRIVAPCEVVPKDPILVTAPLEGIINDIYVKPGERVQKDKTLLSYERDAPLQELEVARKQVEILISEIKRASTLGYTDPEQQKNLAILILRLEKEKANLDLAKYYTSQLDIKAPESGIVMLDNPDQWRGNPVKIGEKILAITDPTKSKLRIWLPEADNVTINKTIPLKIYLNISPEKSYKATLSYVANESVLSEKNIPSFSAEAEWINKPEDLRLGLKGTAVLYGEKASLIYYILRKPWAHLRNFIGF